MATIRKQYTNTAGLFYRITSQIVTQNEVGTVRIINSAGFNNQLKYRILNTVSETFALPARINDEQLSSFVLLNSVTDQFDAEPDLVLDDSFVFTSRNIVYNEVKASNTQIFPLCKRLFKLNRELCGWSGTFYIAGQAEMTSFTLTNQLLSYTRLMKALSMRFAIRPDPGPATSLNYAVRVMLGSSDVTSKIKSISINYSMDSYCGECDIAWADWSMFSQFDVTNPAFFATERIEIFTKINDEAEVSQGKFFIEKRSTEATADGVVLSTWGRSRTALLGEPYASPVDTTWGEDSLTYTDKTVTPNVVRTISPRIVDDKKKWLAPDIVKMLAEREGVSIEWDTQVYQFYVLPYKLDVGTELPIDVISRLAEVVGALVTTDRNGKLKIVYHFDPPTIV